jgi:hypothetical protein
MKALVNALSLLVAGCGAQPSPNIVAAGIVATDANAATAQGTQFGNGWQSNERLYPAKPQSETGPYRQGTTPDNWTYRYFQDGSGSVEPTSDAVMEGWSIGCHDDAMTDIRKCNIRSSKGRLSISYQGSKTPSWVCIIGHDYPGRVGALRIDQTDPVSTDEDGCLPGEYAAKIAKAKTFTTRHVEWPYDETNDLQSPSTGLGSAISLLAFLEKNRGKLNF